MTKLNVPSAKKLIEIKDDYEKSFVENSLSFYKRRCEEAANTLIEEINDHINDKVYCDKFSTTIYRSKARLVHQHLNNKMHDYSTDEDNYANKLRFGMLDANKLREPWEDFLSQGYNVILRFEDCSNLADGFRINVDINVAGSEPTFMCRWFS